MRKEAESLKSFAQLVRSMERIRIRYNEGTLELPSSGLFSLEMRKWCLVRLIDEIIPMVQTKYAKTELGQLKSFIKSRTEKNLWEFNALFQNYNITIF